MTESVANALLREVGLGSEGRKTLDEVGALESGEGEHRIRENRGLSWNETEIGDVCERLPCAKNLVVERRHIRRRKS